MHLAYVCNDLIWVLGRVAVVSVSWQALTYLVSSGEDGTALADPLLQSSIHDPHIGCSKVSEHQGAACHREHTNMVVADDGIVLAHSHGSHVLSKDFNRGHRVGQVGTWLSDIADGKILGHLRQTSLLMLHMYIDARAWQVPAGIDEAKLRISVLNQICNLASFNQILGPA